MTTTADLAASPRYTPFGVLVELFPWEHEWATHVGVQRHLARLESRDAHYYDPRRMEDNERASIAAACCELAAAKHFNKHWGGHVWPVEDHPRYAHLADVGTNIEVRRVRHARNPIAVRERDVTARRIIVGAYALPDDFRHVDILGWAKAKDAWDRGSAPDWDSRGTSRVVDRALLLSPLRPA